MQGCQAAVAGGWEVLYLPASPALDLLLPHN